MVMFALIIAFFFLLLLLLAGIFPLVFLCPTILYYRLVHTDCVRKILHLSLPLFFFFSNSPNIFFSLSPFSLSVFYLWCVLFRLISLSSIFIHQEEEEDDIDRYLIKQSISDPMHRNLSNNFVGCV